MQCDGEASPFDRPAIRSEDRLRSTRHLPPERSAASPTPQALPAPPGPVRLHKARAPSDSGPDAPAAKGGGSTSFRVRRQPFEQLSPLHHDMRSSVSPGRLETIGKPTICHRFETVQRERGAVDLTTEPLEPLSIASWDRYVGVQAHAALTNAAGRDGGPGLDPLLVLRDRLHPIPMPSPRLARFGTRRNPRADGCCAEHRLFG